MICNPEADVFSVKLFPTMLNAGWVHPKALPLTVNENAPVINPLILSDNVKLMFGLIAATTAPGAGTAFVKTGLE